MTERQAHRFWVRFTTSMCVANGMLAAVDVAVSGWAVAFSTLSVAGLWVVCYLTSLRAATCRPPSRLVRGLRSASVFFALLQMMFASGLVAIWLHSTIAGTVVIITFTGVLLFIWHLDSDTPLPTPTRRSAGWSRTSSPTPYTATAPARQPPQPRGRHDHARYEPA